MGNAGDFASSLEDLDGCKSLILLPSDQPSSRRDVQAVETLLEEMLSDPTAAADRCTALAIPRLINYPKGPRVHGSRDSR